MSMYPVAFMLGLLTAVLCYSLLQGSATRGSSAAVVLYRRRALLTSAVAGVLGALIASSLIALK